MKKLTKKDRHKYVQQNVDCQILSDDSMDAYTFYIFENVHNSKQNFKST